MSFFLWDGDLIKSIKRYELPCRVLKTLCKRKKNILRNNKKKKKIQQQLKNTLVKVLEFIEIISFSLENATNMYILKLILRLLGT